MSRRSSLARTVTLVTVALLLLGVGVLLRRGGEQMVAPDDLHPPGRWRLRPPTLEETPDGEELARVLSLPYVSGSSRAPATVGVTRHDSGRALAGLNLYVSGHAPEVVLMDMAGEPVHRWRYPFARAFPDKEPTIDTDYLRRAHLFPNGDLVAIYQGGGMIKIDRDSNLIWTSDLPFYNHLFVTPEGSILAIAKTAKIIPELRADRPVLEDSIVVLSSRGEVERRIPLLDCFAATPYAEIIHPLPGHADIFHTNTILPIGDSFAASSAVGRAGLWVVSLREIDVIAFIDPQTEKVTAAWRGPWRAQHQPVPLASGKILLFDNKGAANGSRVVEFDTGSGELSWQFPRENQERISSPEGGSCQRLTNGNTLITESERGRALEISPDGEVVWEFVSPHRAGTRSELVATLFEVVRFPSGALPFLENPARRSP